MENFLSQKKNILVYLMYLNPIKNFGKKFINSKIINIYLNISETKLKTLNEVMR